MLSTPLKDSSEALLLPQAPYVSSSDAFLSYEKAPSVLTATRAAPAPHQLQAGAAHPLLPAPAEHGMAQTTATAGIQGPELPSAGSGSPVFSTRNHHKASFPSLREVESNASQQNCTQH